MARRTPRARVAGLSWSYSLGQASDRLDGVRQMGQIAFGARFKRLGPVQCQALAWAREHFPNTWIEVPADMLRIVLPLRGSLVELKRRAKRKAPGADANWMMRLLPAALSSEEF